jgi:transposase
LRRVESEKVDPDQLALTFEDIEIVIGKVQEARDRTSSAELRAKPKRTKAAHPRCATEGFAARQDAVIEPDSLVCPCGCGDMVRIGEDVPERLDIVPASSVSWLRFVPNTPVPEGEPESSRRRRSRGPSRVACPPKR